MKKHILLACLCLILLSTCLFDVSECFRLLKRRQQDRRESSSNDLTMVSGRQGGPLAGALTGPLMLATFLFALPLLPTMLMAPLAIAGIPPALNVLAKFVSTNNLGASPNALTSFLAHFQDPLQPAESSSVSASISHKPSGYPQIDILRNIAYILRGAISKKHTPIKDLGSMNNIDKDALKPDELELAEMLAMANGTSTNSTVDPLLEPSYNVQPTEASLSVNSIENTLDKSLKTMHNIDTVVTSIRNVYSVIRNGLRRYEITDTNCQSRIVCEIHQKIVSHNKLLKTFSVSALDLLSLERHVDKFGSLNDKSKQAIKYYIAAARAGFADKNCDQVFENCPTIKSRSLKSLRNFLVFKKLLKQTQF